MEIDRVGQQLGNYRLVRLLRQGGFAEVYLGRQVYLETLAAIKILHQHLGNGQRQNFLKEARTIASLVHPHIVRVLDFGVDDYTPYLVMDYAPHGTLRERYSRGTRLPLQTVISYVKQVASALQYAHQQNLVHCDVKPENMLLGSHDQVLLSDFGIALASHVEPAQEMQEPVGTIAYMAPEQIQGEPCAASDQYSLGIVVYEWLCGERPFQGPLTELANLQLTASPPSLLEKNPQLPPDIEEVLSIALAKDPQNRFAGVKAFANALEQSSQLELQLLPVPDFDLLPSSPGERLRSAIITPVLTRPSARHKRTFSRRALVAGLLGSALVGSGSAVALLLDHLFNRPFATAGQTAHHTPGATPSPTPTPAPAPLGTTLYTYHGHHEVVKAVAWSPGGSLSSTAVAGSRIASASFDATVQVWDATSGDHALKYSQHSNGVKTVAWSPDGIYLASGSEDHTVRVWDATTGKDVLPPYTGHSQAVRSVAWSPDGTRIASGSEDHTVQVWGAVQSDGMGTPGKTILTYRGHSDKVISVAWSPDSSRIASASFDGTVQVWNVATDGNFLAYIYRGHFPNGVRAAAWSPNGNYIASGANDTTVRVWDAKTGQTIHVFRGHTKEVEIVTWSPNGRYLASGSFDATVKLWDVATGHNIYTYTHDTDQVWAVAWSPEEPSSFPAGSSRIASGGNDMMVHVWQAL